MAATVYALGRNTVGGTVLMALDQGTTSSRAIVFGPEGETLCVAQREFPQMFPRPGWVEHDPLEIWASQAGVMTEVLARARLNPADVAAIGITNQRETTVLWDRATSQPLGNAIVWQDRRTAPTIDRLRADGCVPMIVEKTGLVPDAYFSATKLAWLLDNVPGARARAEAGQLAFGTIDTWLAWKLGEGRLHVTDVSNASRTMMFNIHTLEWDDDLLTLFSIPREVLPQVRPSSEVYGDATLPGGASIPLAGMAGDQQAALFGQGCFTKGMAKNTYGTGCFLLLNTGGAPAGSANNLLSTVAWRVGPQTTFALEGSVFVGGAVVQWLRDGLGLIRASGDVEALALSVPDNGGVYFVPAFAGLGAPHWDQYARGAICGLTRGSTAGHIARAAVESIAYQVADLVDAMNRDTGEPLAELRVDGGAAANDLLMQFQADMLQAPVVRPVVTETTALGAAYLAGLAVGFLDGVESLARNWKCDRRFDPVMAPGRAGEMRERWTQAVARARGWER